MRQVGLRHTKTLKKHPISDNPVFPMHIINVSESWNRSSPADRSLWQMHFRDDRQSWSCELSRAFQILMYSLRNLKNVIFSFDFTLWRNGNVFRHKSQMTFPFPIMVQCVRMSQKIGLEGTKFEKTKYVAFRNFRYIYKRCGGGEGDRILALL